MFDGSSDVEIVEIREEAIKRGRFLVEKIQGMVLEAILPNGIS